MKPTSGNGLRAASHEGYSHHDQAAGDLDLAAGLDPRVHGIGRDINERTARQRELDAAARLAEAERRDASAQARDLAAAERDRAADACDAAMPEPDAAAHDCAAPRTAADVLLRALVGPRARAREQRAMAAEDRKQAAQDRIAAAEDRAQATRERARSMADRQAFVRELASAATDPVTGARMRAPGLADLELELQRARRTNAGLVVAYVDVVGLKARNDEHGHAAGDSLLKRVVTAVRDQLRAYDLVVRLGGDEFVCAMHGAALPEIQRRFRLVADALRTGGDPLEITAGFADLQPEDTIAELIARADRDLLEHRRAASRAARRASRGVD